MSYVYLIQKKSDLNKNIFKFGMLKTVKNINKENKIILLIEDKYNCIKMSELRHLMINKFERGDKKDYFIGNESDMTYLISNYYRLNFFNKLNNTIHDKKKDIIHDICMSSILKETEKYEQIIKMTNKKIDVRNILFDSNLNNTEKFEDIIKLISESNVNLFGMENTNYISDEEIIELIKNNDLGTILDKYLNLVHFNEEHPENKNIIYDNFSINIIENNLLVEKKNNKEIFDKILDNSINKLYFSIYKILLLNIDTDELYHKGLYIINKLNKLIKL